MRFSEDSMNHNRSEREHRTRRGFLKAMAGAAVWPLIWTGHGAIAQQPVRPLAPGVLTVIPPEPKTEETLLGPLALQNVTRMNWDPAYWPKTQTLGDKVSRVTLRHNVWNLEFAFKPLRMLYVDVPQPTGKMHRKLIWYMVFRVRNLGKHLNPVPIEDEFGHKIYGTEKVDEVLNFGAAQPTGKIRFFPHFVLESREQGKAYLDRVVPAAKRSIELREMRGAKLFNTVEISRIDIPVGTAAAEKAVWGVVTWENIDPRTDYFSIFVQGLTNAFRLDRTPDGRVVHQLKTLQLNFWRPGDAVLEHEKEIRYGIPSVSNPAEQADILAKYGLQVRVDHLWVYR
jgi:hypothetical protein